MNLEMKTGARRFVDTLKGGHRTAARRIATSPQFRPLLFGVHRLGFLAKAVPVTPGLFCIASMLWLTGSASVSAQTIRVTTYDFGNAWRSEATNSIEQPATQLKKLAPDVILLRGVRGWKMCSQLADALKPAEYSVAICSSFRDANGSNAAPRQVAILSRTGAYFSWSEPWNSTTNAVSMGGLAFAAIQVEGHRFGFSVAEMPSTHGPVSEFTTKQWLETLGSFRNWANNKVEGFVAGVFGAVATNGEAGRLMRAAGFVDAFAWSTGPNGTDAVESHLVPDSKTTGGLLLTHWPMVCDFDFHPVPVVVVAANPPAPATNIASAASASTRVARSSSLIWIIVAALAIVLTAIVLMLIGIRRRLSRLQAQNALLVNGPLRHPAAALGYNIAIAPSALATTGGEIGRIATAEAAPPSEILAEQRLNRLPQGVFAHLTHWLKEAFIQRLMNDRKELLATQQEATLKVLAVDERLARLEMKIQQETSSYEKQIEQLNRELLTAREENLELIRGQIKLLKAEMEDARKRVLETEEA
jgi:hypothetical protein